MVATTVLVVEDDDDLRRSLAGTLADEGYDVVQAGNGCEAISALEDRVPDLVLLDMMMPSGNGWDVLEHLHEAHLAAGPPVIVISAFASSIPRGAASLLRKPLRRDDLLATVASFAAKPHP